MQLYGGSEKWGNECSVQNNVVRGDGEGALLTEKGPITTGGGSLFQCFTTPIEKDDALLRR